ncbi:MAG: 30S ribosomal protein S9 [Verrucomicrobia bacterium GWC2_42_7]|nr:MAG: 30S ribosomal protein S9 [Verrucomicrobia bacterium GWC2_42_7]
MASAKEQIFTATGRRKTAVARVRIKAGNGNFSINEKQLPEFCCNIEGVTNAILAPLKTVDMEKSVDVMVSVDGGGISGQAGAISHGIARALQLMNTELRAPLKKEGLLTRDSRSKERKKPGRPGARKRFQFSKR